MKINILILLLLMMIKCELEKRVAKQIKDALDDRYLDGRGELIVADMLKLYEAITEVITEDIKFQFKNFLGSGSYGFVFEVQKEKEAPVAIKIMTTYHENDGKKYKDKCDYPIIHFKLNDLPGSPAIKIIDELQGFVDFNNRKQLICITILELAEKSLNEAIFDKKSTLMDNSITLGYIFYRLIEGFYQFNFVSRYLHADIKPANLVVVKSASHVYEPKIIDFDLTFKLPKNVSKTVPYHHSQVVYTYTHRPPEMLAFCPDTNCNKELTLNDKLKIQGIPKDETSFVRKFLYYRYYSFDPEFKEDTYALGKSIEDIYKLNLDLIDPKEPFISFIKTTVIKKMTQREPNDRISIEKLAPLVRQEIRKYTHLEPNRQAKKNTGTVEIKKNTIEPEKQEKLLIQRKPGNQRAPKVKLDIFENNINEILNRNASLPRLNNIDSKVIKEAYIHMPQNNKSNVPPTDEIEFIKRYEKTTFIKRSELKDSKKDLNPHIHQRFKRKPANENQAMTNYSKSKKDLSDHLLKNELHNLI